MEDQDVIDLRIIYHVLTKYKLNILVILTVTTALAFTVVTFWPKQYESSSLVRAKVQAGPGLFFTQTSDTIALLSGGASNPAQTYIEMMKSRNVLDAVIKQLELEEGSIDDERLVKDLRFENIRETNLIKITAKGRTPEAAQKLLDAVIASFQDLLSTLDQSENSALSVSFQNRITKAKMEMEKAENELEEGSKGTVEYIQLERQVQITRAVYEMLVKSYEVQKDMGIGHVDFQIIDRPNTPARPSSPNVLAITVMGFVIGILVSLIYIVLMYRKEARRI